MLTLNQNIKKSITLVSFFLSISLFSCGDASTTAREVGEEVAEVIEVVSPTSERAGLVHAPEHQITVPATLSEIEAAEGLLGLDATNATIIIDQWIATLTGKPNVDDSDLLVENLETLKRLLTEKQLDTTKIATVLRNLARETEQAADDAQSKTAHLLANALTSAAATLTE